MEAKNSAKNEKEYTQEAHDVIRRLREEYGYHSYAQISKVLCEALTIIASESGAHVDRVRESTAFDLQKAEDNLRSLENYARLAQSYVTELNHKHFTEKEEPKSYAHA